MLTSVSHLSELYLCPSRAVGGDRGSTVVKVLCNKSEAQLVSVDFSLTENPSDRTMALGSTQPLTEMSTRSISWG